MLPYATRAGTTVREPGGASAVPYLGRLVDFAEPAPDDVCLDVAYGGAVVAGALGPHVSRVASVDAAPERPGRSSAGGRVPTVLFRPGGGRFQPGASSGALSVRADATALPYRTGSFSLVVCRSSLGRMADPAGALREMLRVCRPGGRLVVADLVRTRYSAPEREKLERLRDPSRSATPSVARLADLVAEAGADIRRLDVFTIERPAEPWLADAPDPRAAHRVREALLTEIEGGPRTGAKPRLIGGELWFTQSWAYIAAQPVRS